jgi:hypothetical protein
MAFDDIAPPAFSNAKYSAKRAEEIAYELKTWMAIELSDQEVVNITNEIYRNINSAFVRSCK